MTFNTSLRISRSKLLLLFLFPQAVLRATRVVNIYGEADMSQNYANQFNTMHTEQRDTLYLTMSLAPYYS